MRWDALFADLEAQLAAASGSRAEDAELVRAEVARTSLSDRWRAHVGSHLRLGLRDGTAVAGELLDAAPTWVLLRDGARQVLVPAAALGWVEGLSPAVAAPAGQVERRLGLTAALRALARDRAPVQLRLDGTCVTGTIDRVGADHLDLAEHAPDQVRRAGAVRRVVAIPSAAVLAVTSTTGAGPVPL
ncbi:hypothetical protein [Quadrisphaera sp. DSM 44207]|uniref:hypothetical protein n=1 Tax=Quadrisphaera sp. DSM 44207 TaxID=1881057 RepID=UPI000B8966CE|nr:hypothetical protein [Quadrisphaera sp. DSM 44207]